MRTITTREQLLVNGKVRERIATHIVTGAHGYETLCTSGYNLQYNKERVLIENGTVAKLAMRQPFVLFKGLTFQKLCLPGAFRPGDHHNKMLRPGLCVVHASPQYL